MNRSRVNILLALLDGGSLRGESFAGGKAQRRDRLERLLGRTRVSLLDLLKDEGLLTRKEIRPGYFTWRPTAQGLDVARSYDSWKRETPCE
jgi:hypothetical protein